jgi:hypothetical protein
MQKYNFGKGGGETVRGGEGKQEEGGRETQGERGIGTGHSKNTLVKTMVSKAI